MCVTSLSYTLGVSTHVLLDTSSSSSLWTELQGREWKNAYNQQILLKGYKVDSFPVVSHVCFFKAEIFRWERQKEKGILKIDYIFFFRSLYFFCNKVVA